MANSEESVPSESSLTDFVRCFQNRHLLLLLLDQFVLRHVHYQRKRIKLLKNGATYLEAMLSGI